ncbi:MAG: high frequency lysogenization protein HflD [Gammaproteobacteria bacterium]
MNTEYINKTIALAGMHQALSQVQQIAWENNYDEAQVDVCLGSLFARNPDTYSDVFGSTSDLRPGLIALRTSFTQKNDKQALERARYMVNLMMLSKNVRDNKELGEQVGTTLSLLDEAASNLQDQRDYVIERIAQLYQNTISPLTPRVIVYGDPQILKVDANAAAIRAMLFAGLRSALLWYQAGGSQLNLLLGKSKYLATISQILD